MRFDAGIVIFLVALWIGLILGHPLSVSRTWKLVAIDLVDWVSPFQLSCPVCDAFLDPRVGKAPSFFALTLTLTPIINPCTPLPLVSRIFAFLSLSIHLT
jgi:hypothetical protein